MRVVSVNMNRCLRGRRSVLALSWVQSVGADVLLVQEPWRTPPAPGVTVLEGYTACGGNDLIAAFRRADVPHPERIELAEERWLRLRLAGVWIHAVYASANSSPARAALFDRLATWVGERRGHNHLFAGDFNAAPRPEDGMFGEAISPWTRTGERRALERLLAHGRLSDLGAASHAHYTFERENQGRLTRFRCDLAMVTTAMRGASYAVDHRTRTGDEAFTDHSAVIVDLPVGGDPGATCAVARQVGGGRTIESPPTSPPRYPARTSPENTAMRRAGPSLPVRRAWERGLVAPGQRVLDFGCGKGGDGAWLLEQGVDAVRFDPHPAFGFTAEPRGLFDVVLALYVVNVLPSEAERRAALTSAWRHVRPGGTLLVVSRSSAEIEKNAKRSRWPLAGDGYWSNAARGMFQRGHDENDLAALAASLPDSTVQPARLGSGFAAVRVIRHANRAAAPVLV